MCVRIRDNANFNSSNFTLARLYYRIEDQRLSFCFGYLFSFNWLVSLVITVYEKFV